MSSRCKYCGNTYKKNDANYFYALFVGREIVNKDNYCCEAHYEMHTEKSWSEEWRNGVKRLPKRLGIVFVATTILTLALIIVGALMPKNNSSNRTSNGQGPAISIQDSSSSIAKRGSKRKAQTNDIRKEKAARSGISQKDTSANEHHDDKTGKNRNPEGVPSPDSNKTSLESSE